MPAGAPRPRPPTALMRAFSQEAGAGFLRLAEAEFARRNRLDPEWRQQFAHFAQLAGVMGRDHQPSGDAAMMA